MSQYIAQCSDQSLLNAVTAVLERFSAAKRDPVVKHDQRTAIWTYLFRNKTEEDWINKTATGRVRNAKAAAAVTSRPRPLSSSPPPLAPPAANVTKETRQSPPHMMDMEVSPVEEIIEASDSDVDVDDSNLPNAAPQLSSAQLLMQATQTHGKQLSPPKPKKQTNATPQKRSYTPKQNAQSKQTKAALMTQSVKQANLLAQSVKQAALIQAVKNNVSKQTVVIATQNSMATQGKTTQVIKQTIPKTTKTTPKVLVKQPAQQSSKQTPSSLKLQSPKPLPQSPMQPPASPRLPQASPRPLLASPKPPLPRQPVPSPKTVASTVVKTVTSLAVPLPVLTQTTMTKSLPSAISTSHKSPLIKQRPLLKNDLNLVSASPSVMTQLPTTMTTVIQPIASTSLFQTQTHNKVTTQVTRSLLIRPPVAQAVTTVGAAISQATTGRRGVVRVLSPANAPSGKSLISPRALLQDTPTSKKRTSVANPISATTMPQLQSLATGTSVVNSMPAAVTSAVQTRTVQLAGGRTVQLAANQTVHLPGGQSVQLSSGHTLQLSSLQLPTHSVRLPSGQTVQLATPQAMQALKASTAAKTTSPRAQTTSIKSNHSIQVPISTVQLTGQTVQLGGQTVQLAGQSVQLTGHTVKLPSGQSVQVASQNVLPSSVQLPSGQTVQLPNGQTVQLPSGQTVQLPSGQTVQLATGNMQAVQITGSSVQLQPSGQNVQMAPQTVQLSSGQNVQLGTQTVQIGGQTVQIASGQTVQLPSGQTIQLPSGQTVQLSSGQTLQLASGQTVQLASQSPKGMSQVLRNQTQVDKAASAQPVVAKLLTNAQGQMMSLEGLAGGGRAIVSGIRPRPSVRVLSPATRLTRPLLLTSAKPLHNIILQQSDGTVRVPSSVGVNTSQTIVISNIAASTVTTPPTTAPVLKLQQPTAAPGVATSSGVRSVLMDGQQLKLVGGRHVLARILRPAHPPNQ